LTKLQGESLKVGTFLETQCRFDKTLKVSGAFTRVWFSVVCSVVKCDSNDLVHSSSNAAMNAPSRLTCVYTCIESVSSAATH